MTCELKKCIAEYEQSHRRCVEMIKKRDSKSLRQLHQKIVVDLEILYQSHLYWYGEDYTSEES